MDLTSVNPYKHVLKVAEKLKEMGLEKPEFVDYVKSGSDRERPPENPDFFYIRAAAILRKLAKGKPLGVNRLRNMFGKRKKGKRKPEKKRKTGGKIIRVAMQNLEKLNLVEKTKKGRVITSKGMKLLAQCAKEIKGIKESKTKEAAKEKKEENKMEVKRRKKKEDR